MERDESGQRYILSSDEQQLLRLNVYGEVWPRCSGVHLLELAELRLANVLDIDTNAPQQAVRETMRSYKERHIAVLLGIIEVVATDVRESLALEAEAFLMQSEN